MTFCTRCSRLIAGTPADPVHATSRGRFHAECLRADADELRDVEAARRQRTHDVRSAAMKARHARGEF